MKNFVSLEQGILPMEILLEEEALFIKGGAMTNPNNGCGNHCDNGCDCTCS